MTLWVRGDDESLEAVGPRVPSCASPDYGQPFAAIFERYDRDFYKIDPHLFSPAVVTFANLDTGTSLRFGRVQDEVLRRSISLRQSLAVSGINSRWVPSTGRGSDTMHFAVLCSPDSWYFKDLARAAGGDFEITPLAFRQLVGRLGGDDGSAHEDWAGGIDLARVDAVLVRTMPPGSLEQVVFRMDVLGRLEARGKVVVNPPRAIEAAVDKYLASAKLAAAGLVDSADRGLPDRRRRACSISRRSAATWSSSRCLAPKDAGMTRLTDEGLAQRAFSLLVQLGAVLYLQEFIPHDGYRPARAGRWPSTCGPCAAATRSIGGPTSAAAPRAEPVELTDRNG